MVGDNDTIGQRVGCLVDAIQLIRPLHWCIGEIELTLGEFKRPLALVVAR